MDDRTEHVLDAIDGALAWEGPHADWCAVEDWEADAMRWSGETLATADDRRESDAASVYRQASQVDPWPGDYDGVSMLPSGWVDVGYTTDGGVFSSYLDATSQPDAAVPNAEAWGGPRILYGRCELRQLEPRSNRGVRSFNVNLDLSGVRHALSGFRTASPEAAELISRAFGVPIEMLGPQGQRRPVDLSPVESDHESPRNRALRLRQERNTGPQATAFRHRGA